MPNTEDPFTNQIMVKMTSPDISQAWIYRVQASVLNKCEEFYNNMYFLERYYRTIKYLKITKTQIDMLAIMHYGNNLGPWAEIAISAMKYLPFFLQ